MTLIDPDGLLFMTTVDVFQRGTSLNQAIQHGTPGTAAAAAVAGAAAAGVTAAAIATRGGISAIDGKVAGPPSVKRTIILSILRQILRGVDEQGVPPPEPPGIVIPPRPPASAPPR